MKLRAHATSIALVAAALGVGAYAWLVDRGSVTESEREARAGRVLPAFRKDDLSTIEIVRGGERARLEKTRDGWRMRAPRDEAADFAAVERLVHELESATRVRAARDVDARTAGLDAPRVTTTITMGTIVYRLALGGAAASPERAAYARLDDGEPFVVRKELAATLDKSADEYRDRTIAPYGERDIARLELGGARASAAIERVDAMDFRVAGGKRASRAAVETVFAALADLRAERFVDDKTADAATREPAITLRATPRDSGASPIALSIGGACPDLPTDVVLVRTEPAPRVSACVPKPIADALAVRAEALADPRVLSSHEDEIGELRLEAIPAGAVLDLARVGGGWHERAPQDRALLPEEAESANVLAVAVAHVSGAIVDEPFGRAVARVRVVRAQSQGEEVVEIGAPEASGSALVRRAADGAVLRVAADDARALTPRLVAIRSRNVWSPSAESMPIARVATSCGTPQELVHGDSGWTMASPRGFDADGAAALELANEVIRLKAEAWVADADDGRFGFDRAACSVTVTVAQDGGARTLRLTFGREVGGAAVYARTDADGAVLIAPKSLRDLAARVMIDRGALRFEHPERSLLIRPGKPPTKADAIGATDALRALWADAVVHVGPPRKGEGFEAPTLEVRGDTKSVKLGAAATLESKPMVYARASGVDATFAVEKSKLDALLSAF